MKRESYPECVRSALFHAIKKTSVNLDVCVKALGKDFSRKRKLPLKAMLLMLIGMGGGSLSKELYDWFGYTSNSATASAFVQQRNEIRPKAIEMILTNLSHRRCRLRPFKVIGFLQSMDQICDFHPIQPMIFL